MRYSYELHKYYFIVYHKNSNKQYIEHAILDKQQGGLFIESTSRSWDELFGHMRSPRHLEGSRPASPPAMSVPRQEGLAMDEVHSVSLVL